MISCIVFDFDGTIIDSNQIKYDAFFQIFPSNEKTKMVIKKILDTYREKSRYFIIRQILVELYKRKFLKISKLENGVSSYAGRYNAIVEKRSIVCNEIKGARKSLEELSKSYNLYINSTTPLNSLKRILTQRLMSNYFKGVYGGPKSKLQNLLNILKKEKIPAKKILIVGDGKSDLELARKVGCHFIGLRNMFNNFDGSSFKILDDLTNLQNSIDELNL